MDPYLEDPALWPDVHNSLIAEIRRHLAPLLRPKYYVGLEERTYIADSDELVLVGRPDITARAGRPAGAGEMTHGARPPEEPRSSIVTVELPMPDHLRETYLEVRSIQDGEVVTVLELLSPSNKVEGEGRRIYERKRQIVLGSLTHLVEIDLLRTGKPMPFRGAARTSSYRILISRQETRPQAALLLFSLKEPIPRFMVPLRPDDAEPELDLGALLAGLYEQAGYDLVVDYHLPPSPPLANDEGVWADALLRTAGKR